MVGVTAYGTYVPLFRLDKKVIGGKGEKAICNFDEDSITMAVEAINNCLKGKDREMVDSLYFGTTTSLYKEHLGATTIAMASDLKENVYAAEFGSSLRAGTAAFKAGIDAVKAGSAKNVLVSAADCRLGPPGSALERNFGDGAAALLIGDTDVAVTMEGTYSVYNEIIDVWRSDADRFVHTWEDRFAIEQGYLPSMHQAVAGLMEKFHYKPSDFAKVVFYSPDGRRSTQLARGLGFDIKAQLQNPLIDIMGNTGAASALMLLVATLEEAKVDDLILLASYGNGADAFACRVTENIDKIRGQGLGLNGNLASKRVMTDYLKYLRWRGILPIEKTPGPVAAYSAVAAKREYDRNISLHGSRCNACGYIQYPPQRVCTHCYAKDQMEPYSFVGKKGKIFTYTLDYITPRAEVPTVTVEVDFEGGGRIQCYMTEVDVDRVEVGLPVEMTFRRYTLWEEIALREGVYLYFWEAKPLRA
ncbi:MAG: OB-fold domain-containing protein [Deltaproteobacteria bacterium]|nr:OB-fold domain-containing protein [Deltaproteobacteria bacterium]